MGSYKFYVAAMAISSMILLQCVCACESYVDGDSCDQAEVWDTVFRDQKSVDLMEHLFTEIKTLATNEVCSDTYRTLFEYIRVQLTDKNALKLFRKFVKMVGWLLNEMTENTENYKETKKLLDRILNEEKIRILVLKVISQSVKLLEKPDDRKRLAKMVEVVVNIIRPSEAERDVKEKGKSFVKQTLSIFKRARSFKA